MNDVLEFQGENRWLSNFWPCQVIFEGITFPSVENAYQAAKTTLKHRDQFVSCTAGQAKRLGRIVDIRPEWQSVKLEVMKGLIEQKFSKGSSLGVKLLSTGTCLIVEGNNWNDRFWGVCKGKGENNLGKLIMNQRSLIG